MIFFYVYLLLKKSYSLCHKMIFLFRISVVLYIFFCSLCLALKLRVANLFKLGMLICKKKKNRNQMKGFIKFFFPVFLIFSFVSLVTMKNVLLKWYQYSIIVFLFTSRFFFFYFYVLTPLSGGILFYFANTMQLVITTYFIRNKEY